MYCRYVINKINRPTNCYQGVLVTLGTLMHKGVLSVEIKAEAESLFLDLINELPIPPEITEGKFEKSISWLKKDSTQFLFFSEKINRAASILQKLGYEILFMEADSLNDVLYEDAHQILVHAGTYKIQLSPVSI